MRIKSIKHSLYDFSIVFIMLSRKYQFTFTINRYFHHHTILLFISAGIHQLAEVNSNSLKMGQATPDGKDFHNIGKQESMKSDGNQASTQSVYILRDSSTDCQKDSKAVGDVVALQTSSSPCNLNGRVI